VRRVRAGISMLSNAASTSCAPASMLPYREEWEETGGVLAIGRFCMPIIESGLSQTPLISDRRIKFSRQTMPSPFCRQRGGAGE